MNLDQAIKVLDDQKHIAYAWLIIKESLIKLKQERDLVMNDFKEIQDNPGVRLCVACKHGTKDVNTYPCKSCLSVSHFEWRGLRKKERKKV